MSNTTVSDNTSNYSASSLVRHVDPATLLVDTNVRLHPAVDADLVASVRDLGVLVPLVAVRTSEGALRVRFGHRRTAAAIEAGRATVPVVVAADEVTDDAAQVERLVTQWAENEHRAGLTTAERVGVIAQLAAFGVSAAKIAKRTRVPRAQVDAAFAVARSDLAKAAVARYSDFLDLVQAAVVADFEDDPEAVKALVVAAKNGQFDHTAQRLRDARAEAARRAEVEAALREAGTTVLERPKWNGPTEDLATLRSPGGDLLDADSHRECPGHAAYITTEYGYLDPGTGAPVEQDAVDDTGEYDEDDCCTGCGAHISDPHADDCGRPTGAATCLEWRSYFAPRYVCTDPRAHGHVGRHSGRDAGTARKTSAEMSEPEREASRAQRRDVIESNKAWISAETVRRDWLRTYLTRKTAPKGTAAFIAAAIASDAEIVAGIGGNALAADLLGCDQSGYGRSTTWSRSSTRPAKPAHR